MNKKDSATDQVNLLDYWQVLIQRKKILTIVPSAALVISIAVSLFLPDKFAAKTTIMPPQDNPMGSAIASQLSSGLGGLATGLIGVKSQADTWVSVLKSQTVLNAVIERFGLEAAYEAETMEEARARLERNVSVEKGNSDVITVRVEDRDPQRAAQMANVFVEELDKMNRRFSMSAGGRMRRFVDGRLNEAKKDFERTEVAFRAFQEKSGAFKIDDQSRMLIEAMGAIRGQVMAKEVELKTLFSYATPDYPQAVMLEREIKELKAKLREMNRGGAGANVRDSSDIFIPTGSFPGIGMEYARLLRDLKTQEALYETLIQQLELAKIHEAKDSPTVQVLDSAEVPEKKSGPRRTLIVLLSTISSFFCAVFAVFIMEYINAIKPQEN